MEQAAHVRDALVRIQTEYVEMPYLRLTAQQAQRLWRLPGDACEAALAALVRTRFLVRSSDGGYVRNRVPRPSIDRVESLTQAG
jgi:hypothetical protein